MRAEGTFAKLGLLPIASAGAVLLLAAVAETGDRPDRTGTLRSVEVEEVIYRRAGGVDLGADVYRPDAPGARSPGVLTVHSGAWTRGTRARMARVARSLAEAGYVAVNIDYRLAPEHPYPAALEDCRAAVAWMRRHADAHGIDPDRIGAFGYSAGGHLVALLATQPVAGPGAADPDAGARIGAAVVGGAPTDLRRLPPNRAVPRFLGGTPDEIPEVYAEASPIHHVRPGLPPVFIYHGRNDWIVDESHGRLFADALERSGVPHRYVEMPLGHVATYRIDGDTFEAVVAFLDRWLRGAADPSAEPPTGAPR